MRHDNLQDTRTSELTKLIAEQRKDDKMGRRVWPESTFGAVSLDRLRESGIEIDDEGSIVRLSAGTRRGEHRTRTYGREAWNKGARPGNRCQKHPGEATRDKNGEARCKGCARVRAKRYRDRLRASRGAEGG